MNEIIAAIAARLTPEDERQLKSVYQPVVVAVPPTDACKHLCVTPDGEIRIYGVSDRVEPTDEGKRVFIFSRDGGLSWKKRYVDDLHALGAATRNPDTGRYMTCYPQENREEYPPEFPRGGVYAEISDGYDAPVRRFVKLSDLEYHFQKLPYYLQSRKRWLIVAEYRHENHEKFIVVMYSDDDGETWHTQELPKHAPMFETVAPHKGPRWQDYSCEPTVVELSDGTLWMLERTSQDFHYQRFSKDGGETWSDPEPSIFHGTLTMPVLYKLSDGRIIHFWCNNQPLPEMDHAKEWPPLSEDELTGVWENAFTNRDANHLAISEDDGKNWIGFRELCLNGLRNRADYRSVGGTDSRDKSVHQGEMIELPFGKVLLSFGQNAAARKVVIFDPKWLYERARQEDFRYGLDNVTTHMFVKSNSGGYRGFSGHASWNRTYGALLCQDPDGNFEEALAIGRTDDPRLFSQKQGVVWNYPAAKRGEVAIRLRIEGSGLRLCLTDHWYNACDETVADFAPVSFAIDKLEKGVWHEVRVRFDARAGRAELFIDEEKHGEHVFACPAPYGLCYLHLQTLAESTDYEGTIVKRMSAKATDEE